MDVWSPYASVVGVTAQGIPNLYPENISLENTSSCVDLIGRYERTASLPLKSADKFVT